MTILHAGAVIERVPGPKYTSDLHFAELLPAHSPPAPRTLARWRAEVPESFVFSLVAPQNALVSELGPLRFDEGLEQAFGWLLDAARALNAHAVVVPTDRRLTTGQRDRDLLQSYFERLKAQEGLRVVWSPAGLWEQDSALRFAEKTGVHCGFDPLENPPTGGDVAYCRVKGLGSRRRISEGMMVSICDAIEASGAEEAYVSIESPRSFREAQRLQKLADEEL